MAAIVATGLLGVGVLYGRGILGPTDSKRSMHLASSPSRSGTHAPEPAPTQRTTHVDAIVAPYLMGTGSAPTDATLAQRPISTSQIADTPAGPLSRVEYKFGKARTFQQALILCGASESEAIELIAALNKLINFRRGKPEDRFIFERDADQQLHAFEYRTGITEIFRAVRDQQGALRGHRIEVPIERRRLSRGTYVAGTLGHSLSALGLGVSLAGMVTEAFGTRISFTRDTRAGDSVKIVVDEEYVDGTFLRYGVVHAVEYTSERVGKLQAFWYEPARGEGEFYDSSGRALHGGWLRTPVRYDHISSTFNLKRKHPILKRIVPHLGIDYAAGTGTPVWAAAGGLITFAGPRGPNGNLVSMRHSNGYESHYAHLWRISPGVKPGVRLTQRQVLGFVGSTGRSTGPHLHFAMKRGGRFLDPATLMNGAGPPLPESQIPVFRTAVQRLRQELEQVPLAPAPSSDDSLKDDETVEGDEDLDL